MQQGPLDTLPQNITIINCFEVTLFSLFHNHHFSIACFPKKPNSLVRMPLVMKPPACDPELEKMVLRTAQSIDPKKVTNGELITYEEFQNVCHHLHLGLWHYTQALRQKFPAAKKDKHKLRVLIISVLADIARLSELYLFMSQYNLTWTFWPTEFLKELLNEELEDIIEQNINVGTSSIDLLRHSLIILNAKLGAIYSEIRDCRRSFGCDYRTVESKVVIFYETVMNLCDDLSPEYKKGDKSVEDLQYSAFMDMAHIDIQNGNPYRAAQIMLSWLNSSFLPEWTLDICCKLSEAFEINMDFAQAHFWLKKAFAIFPKLGSPLSHIGQNFDKSFELHKKTLETYLNKHYEEIKCFLQSKKRDYKFSKAKDALQIFPSCRINRLDLEKILIKVPDCKMIQNSKDHSFFLQPLSVLPLKTLQKIIRHIEKKELFKQQNELRKEQNHQLEAKVAEEVANLSMSPPVSAASLMATVSSSPNGTDERLSPPPLPQASFSQQQSKLKALKDELRLSGEDSDSEEELTPAKRLGFSEEIFGSHAFHQCRMRGIGASRYYVVYKDKYGDEIPPPEIERDYMHHRFPNAKIIPPTGEIGFKWMFPRIKGKDCQPFLYGKDRSAWRLIPTQYEVNAKGEVAFLYGEFHDTKRGAWDNDKFNACAEQLAKSSAKRK